MVGIASSFSLNDAWARLVPSNRHEGYAMRRFIGDVLMRMAAAGSTTVSPLFRHQNPCHQL